MKILIYGAGRTGLQYSKSIPSENVIGFLETRKEHEKFCGLPVYGLEELGKLDYDEIHVANVYVETLYALLARSVSKKKIVIANYRLFIDYVSREGYGDIRFSFPLVMTRPMLMEDTPYSTEIDFGGGRLQANYDYVRYTTLKLLAKEIRERNISGDIAELGVFQGEFASLMNYFLPERNLHLFDTFEGFVAKDKEYEIEHGYTNADKFLEKGEFANTCVKDVLKKMNFPEKCVFHQGYFPDTIPEDEITYALVSLDCDLYAPMLAGLRYFLPRLSKGGYIMMHDYNDKDFRGNRKAVEDCEKEFGPLFRVPIPDCNGSLIISR